MCELNASPMLPAFETGRISLPLGTRSAEDRPISQADSRYRKARRGRPRLSAHGCGSVITLDDDGQNRALAWHEIWLTVKSWLTKAARIS